MKTIEERAKKVYPSENNPYEKIKRIGYIRGAKEQKIIDDAKLLKLKSSWEKEEQINHDDEANYNQGYHDAVEKACKWLKKELQKLAMDELKDNFIENEFKFVLKSQIPIWLINFHEAMKR